MRAKLYVISFLAAIGLVAQDTQYSQFYSNPIYLNPAFVGTGHNTRLAINHRVLWPELPQSFASYSASLDYSVAKLNSGFGILAFADQEGTAALKTNGAAAIYSYHANFNGKVVFQPAVQVGYIFRTIDRSKFLFGDQIDFGVDGAPSQDPTLVGLKMRNYLDVGTGFLMYTRTYWIGSSFQHLTQPNRSLLGGEDRLQIRYTIHAGGRFKLKGEYHENDAISTIAPSLVYKRQGNFQQFDIGASAHLQPVIVGFYYRGLPFLSKSFDQINQDAIITQVGFEFMGLEFGYSYDMNISGLGNSGGGAHEIALQYNFQFPLNPKHVSHNKKVLHCPTFTHKLNY